MNSQKRPVYLNLLEFSFPATAITSLLHRISGALLFLALPLLIYGLGLSLQGEEGMAVVEGWWSYRTLRLMAAVTGWALLHHWLAGWRFLFIDIELGVRRNSARATARFVNLLSLAGWLALVVAAL